MLRVIQEGVVTKLGAKAVESEKVDVRIVASTSRDLRKQVDLQQFREDLYYTIAGVTIQIPSLQERRDDILPLAKSHLQNINKMGSGNIPGYSAKHFSQEAEQLLQEYHWPGNIRELQQIVQQAAIWTDGGVIEAVNIKSYLSPTANK